MVTQAIMKSLLAYFLLAVVSFVVAVVIKGIVVYFTRAAEAQKKEESAAAKLAASLAPPAPVGMPRHHLVAVIAAAHAMVGGRIVRVEDVGEDKGWTVVGRTVHQTSHDVHR